MFHFSNSPKNSGIQPVKRFTLFFDPGRIKRGLLSQQELGIALHEGKRYTL